jgi:hypothetical protein
LIRKREGKTRSCYQDRSLRSQSLHLPTKFGLRRFSSIGFRALLF